MSFPNTCDYQFYAKIMAALFVVFTSILYFNTRKREVKPDIISCMGVSAIAVIVLSIIGSLFGIIQGIVLIEIIVAGIIFIALWFFKKE